MISIVTICPWHYAKWIKECCDSVVNQTKNENLEHIIVTIGWDFGRPYHSMQKEIRLNHDPGLSTCRNIGVAATKGEYVMMLDADDWLAPDFIEKVTPHLQEGILICGSLERAGDEKGISGPPLMVSVSKLLECNTLNYNCIFHRNDFLGYDQELDQFGWEDVDLWIRMLNNPEMFYLPVPEAVLHYRVHADSHTKRSWVHHEARIQYLRVKHGVK